MQNSVLFYVIYSLKLLKKGLSNLQDIRVLVLLYNFNSCIIKENIGLTTAPNIFLTDY